MVDYSTNTSTVYSDNEATNHDLWSWTVNEAMKEAVAREFDKKEKYMMKQASSDAVNHPNYYNKGEIEVIDAIDDWGLGFCLGNAVKYIARAGNKYPDKKVEDLKKAIWYIQHEIDKNE